MKRFLAALVLGPLCGAALGTQPAELIPPASGMVKDRPRLLLRPADTPLAISLAQFRKLPRDEEFQAMLRQLEAMRRPRAAALALVYHLTGRQEAAERAIAILRDRQAPQDKRGSLDPFDVYFTLQDTALAYDWLHGHERFDAEARAALRRRLQPFVERAVRLGDDHIFHNYIWMYDSGAMLWALATAGEDPAMDVLYGRLRERFNRQLYAAMEYLGGSNGDAAGYWCLYCQNPGLLVLLAAQSAFEKDLIGIIRRDHGDWLNRQLDYLALSILPDMRFVPWGDIVAGFNGGASHVMADKIDALAWALRSPHGAYLSRWLAAKRGPERFHGDLAIFYFLYTRHLTVEPATPPLAILAGGPQGGHIVMRSDWTDGATVVGFRCTDFFGQHLHLDQGSFVIYRNGMLALDAGTYRSVAGPQMATDAHNTLLLGGQGQRSQRFQSAATVEAFTRRLPLGLETGDILFFRDAGDWAAAAGQFAQAYRSEEVSSCARQLLFLRPGTLAVVDHLVAPEGKSLPEVRWLLHVPGRPEIGADAATATNGRSYLRCRALAPAWRAPQVEPSYRTPADPNSPAGRPRAIDVSRLVFAYEGKPRLTLVHLLEVGDGRPAAAGPAVKVEIDPRAVRLRWGGKTFVFSSAHPFDVSSGER